MDNIAVIFGGVSTEHEISCRSAATIIASLRNAGKKVYTVGICKTGEWLYYDGDVSNIVDGTWSEIALEQAKQRSQSYSYGNNCVIEGISPFIFSPSHFFEQLIGVRPDVIYPAVHGINCEDGVLQGFLELTGIPYVGSGVTASALGMEKAYCKKVWNDAGISQVPHILVTRDMLNEDNIDNTLDILIEKLGIPMFLKPSSGGSSVGTASVHHRSELKEKLLYVSSYDFEIIAESFINARELEVAVMGNSFPKAACVGEIKMDSSSEYYDYKTKYSTNSKSYISMPAEISSDISEFLRKEACKAYMAIGCTGYARVDFFMDKTNGKIYLNEINTLPGFTSISLFPKAWEHEGYTLSELLLELCSYAIEKFQMRTRQEV